ncbi:MAG: oligosaccharide flippase family protein [Desulfobulbus sp.]
MLYYFLPREPENRSALIAQTYFFVLLTGGACCAGLLLFQDNLATFMNNPQIVSYIHVLAIYTFLMIMSAFIEVLLIAEGKSHFSSIIKVISEFFRGFSVVLTALLTRSIYAVFCALIVVALTRCAFQWYYLRKEYGLSLRHIQWRGLKRQLSYSLPVGCATIAFLIQQKIDSFIVSFRFPPDIFALYAIGTYSSLPIVTIIMTPVANVMVPELSRCQKEGNVLRILSIWSGALRKTNLLLFPFFIFFFLVAEDFIVFLFTDQYLASVDVFRISLFIIILSGANADAILNVYAETRYQMKIALVRIPVTIGLLYVFIDLWGICGATAAHVLSFSAFRFVMLVKSARVIGVPLLELLQVGVNCKIMAAAILAGCAILLMKMVFDLSQLWMLVVSAPVFLVVFIVAALKLNVVARSEIMACFLRVMPEVFRRKCA